MSPTSSLCLIGLLCLLLQPQATCQTPPFGGIDEHVPGNGTNTTTILPTTTTGRAGSTNSTTTHTSRGDNTGSPTYQPTNNLSSAYTEPRVTHSMYWGDNGDKTVWDYVKDLLTFHQDPISRKRRSTNNETCNAHNLTDVSRAVTMCGDVEDAIFHLAILASGGSGPLVITLLVFMLSVMGLFSSTLPKRGCILCSYIGFVFKFAIFTLAMLTAVGLTFLDQNPIYVSNGAFACLTLAVVLFRVILQLSLAIRSRSVAVFFTGCNMAIKPMRCPAFPYTNTGTPDILTGVIYSEGDRRFLNIAGSKAKYDPKTNPAYVKVFTYFNSKLLQLVVSTEAHSTTGEDLTILTYGTVKTKRAFVVDKLSRKTMTQLQKEEAKPLVEEDSDTEFGDFV